MKITSSTGKKIQFLTLSKIVFVIYILYANVISWSLFVMPGLSILSLSCALLLVIAQDKGRLYLGDYFGTFVCFLLYSVIIGILVAVNKCTMLENAQLIAEYCISMYLILRYTYYDGHVGFAMSAFVLQGIVAAVLTLSTQTLVGNRATFSENVNVNVVGTMAVFSLEFLLFRFIKFKKNLLSTVLVLAACILLLLVTIQTVSKKAIIAGIFSIVLWLLCCFRASFSRKNIIIRILILSGIVLLIYSAYHWYIEEHATDYEYMLWRFSLMTSGTSTAERMMFIKSALETFLEHPLFGVGLNNFRYFNSIREVYSHCFFTEILACSGIVGTFIFCTPMISSIVMIVRLLLYKCRHKSVYSYEDISELIYMIVMVLVFLFSCSTQIIMHVYSLFYFMAIMIAYAINEKRRIFTQNDAGGIQVEQNAY